MKKSLLLVGLLTAGVATAQYSEDFESVSTPNLPTGWTQNTAATDGGFQTTTDYTSQYFQFDPHTTYVGTNDDECNCDKANEELISASFTVPASGLLSFEYVLGQYYGESAEVGISTDGGATNTQLEVLASTAVGGGDHDWGVASYDISAYAGQTVNIVWTYHDNADWGSGLMIDDVAVTQLAGEDMEMTAIMTAPAVLAGNVNIEGTVTNRGSNNVTSVDITWNDGSGPNTQTFNVNLNFGDSYNFTHGTQLNAVAGNTYNVTCTVTLAGDADASNNSLTKAISAVNVVPTKRTVGEEKTGEWCGWCPRGAVALAEMEISNPNDFIGIAVHNSDGMAISSYDGPLGGYIPGGFPGAGVDRVETGDPSDFATMHAARAGMVPPAEIWAEGVYDGNTLNVSIRADFVAVLQGDYRLAAVVVEDNVTGAGQENYYSFQYNDLALVSPNSGSMANFDWQAAPGTVNPIYHDHVARALGDNEINGAAGSVPAFVNNGFTHWHSYAINQSGSWNMANVHVIGMLVNGSTGEILNAYKGNVVASAAGLEEKEKEMFSVNAVPNPTAGETALMIDLDEAASFEVAVLNMMGQVVYTISSEELAAGSYSTIIDLTNESNGMYFAHVTVNGQSQTVKINVAR